MPKRRRLNRDLVIAQAAALADYAGDVQALSLTALAQALGIRPPSLYNHVTSLEDVQQGMALLGLRQLLADLRQASLGLVGREALTTIATAYRHFAHRHPGLYPLTIRAPEKDETELAALAQELLQMLLLMTASMGLQGDDAIHAIRGLRAILHGFTSLEAAGGYKFPLDQEESFHRLINAYLDGLT
jgi:AcrR family transcriptional regulator